MFVRAMILAGGLSGSAALSQFPEYAQQYTQRLGGAVDSLGQVVADFDASAQAAGLSREEALAEFSGAAFLERRREDMTRTIARHTRLSADLAALQGAGPFVQAYHSTRLTDPQIARAALAAFRPAVPLTFEGVALAGAGFALGAALFSALVALLRWPFRRRAATRLQP